MSTAAQDALRIADAFANPDLNVAAQTEMSRLTVALQDQLQAAHAESLRLADADSGESEISRRAADYPEWVRLSIASTIANWMHGRVRLCLHNPSMVRPEPVYVAAWMPDVVVCADCTDLLAEVESDVLVTCDGCGSRSELTGGRICAGMMVFVFGICDGCRW